MDVEKNYITPAQAFMNKRIKVTAGRGAIYYGKLIFLGPMDKTIILEDYEVYYTVYDKKDKSFIPEEIATTKRVDGGKYALIKREGYISITIPNSLARFLPKK